MKHPSRTLILGFLVLFFVLDVALFTGFTPVVEPGGNFRLAQNVEPYSNACYDTDNGANQFVLGATRYLNWTFVDSCAIDDSLYEGYCASNERPTLVQINCTKGCKDGACIK